MKIRIIADRELAGRDLRPTLEVDLEIELGELRAEMLDYLELIEPSGFSNPQVRFISRGLEVRSKRRVGGDGAHLKLAVSDGWVTYDAIAFRLGDWADKNTERIDLCYRFEMNEFNGRKSLQLNVVDIRESD